MTTRESRELINELAAQTDNKMSRALLNIGRPVIPDLLTALARVVLEHFPQSKLGREPCP